MGMIFCDKLSKIFSSATSGDQRSNLRFVKNINLQKATEPYHNGHDFSRTIKQIFFGGIDGRSKVIFTIRKKIFQKVTNPYHNWHEFS